MKETVYITGHKHPDTDATIAAIAYAYLKNKLGEVKAIPLRLGHINQETKFVLDYFGVKPPIIKDSMKPQVGDLDYDSAYTVGEEISIQQAWNIIQENHLNSLPVTDQDNKLIGIASLSNLTRSYMEVWDDKIIGRSHTPLYNILDVLNAKTIVKGEENPHFDGKMSVFAMSRDNQNIKELVSKGDIVILADRKEAQEFTISQKVSLMILTNGTKLDDKLCELAKEKNVTVITTEYDTFMAARLLPQSIPIKYVMTTDNLISFKKSDNIDDIKKVMAETRYRSYPIVDDRNIVQGTISRYHLISNEKKKLILVDHNEKNQSISDIDDAEIVEIIDHHRVANIQTSGPVFFRNEPVGSTSTIISKMFFESGIRPPKHIAGILSAAIISDTLLFRSPTSTDTDRRVLERMSKIADINPEEFAMKMFKAGTSLKGKKPEDLINGDVKIFPIGEEKVRVGQVMTMNPDELQPIKDELMVLMENKIKTKGESMFLLMLTDIFNKTSDLIVVGRHKDKIAEEFDTKIKNGIITAPGVLSRKKQVIPKITAAILSDK
ncbi:MAG: putative manganese-dependent inorganic diphosphatase [Tissierellia bacterium]|nr:putative manganese-dependent inorganic diphosphatase [Tissierellia bacterium]